MMEPIPSRVLLLLYFFPICAIGAPAAQEEQRATNMPRAEQNPLVFPGPEAFLIIIGLKNASTPPSVAYPNQRPFIPTTYRPLVTYGPAQNVIPTASSTSMDKRESIESESAECRAGYAWENVSPFSNSYRQLQQNQSLEDTRLSIEALFKLANRMESLLRDDGTNLVFSPIGLTSVLGQLMLAARGNSLTQLENLLAPGKISCRGGAANKFHSSFRSLVSQLWRRRGSESYELSARNALFYQSPGQKLSQEFTRRLSTEYATEIFPADFRIRPESTLSLINEWAKEASRGKIDKLVPNVPPRSTTAIISSVTYFKGRWEEAFNKQFTGPAPFYLDGDKTGRVKTINYMRAEFEVPYAESKKLGCRLVALPYTNKEAALYLILPLGPRRKAPASPSAYSSNSDQQQFSQNLDIPLTARIQEIQSSAGTEGHYGGRMSPSQRVSPSQVSRTPVSSYQNDESDRHVIVYPGPYALPSLAPRNRVTYVRSRRQDNQPESAEPCSITTTTRPREWWTRTTTSRPCLTVPVVTTGSSPYSPSNLHLLASRLGPEEFSELVRQAKQGSPTRVSVILPRLSMSTNVKLKDALAALGLASIFGAESDLSGAVDDGDDRRTDGWGRKDSNSANRWKVDEVWQQSELEVTEYGTEAASGTAAGIVDYSGDDIVFKANSPFLCIVRHEATGAPIFWASVVNPS